MTYSEVTVKLETLTMGPADWKQLDEYMNGPKDKFREWTAEYRAIVKSYQAREEAKRPVCNTLFGTCRYCGFGFKCRYSGYCEKQTHT